MALFIIASYVGANVRSYIVLLVPSREIESRMHLFTSLFWHMISTRVTTSILINLFPTYQLDITISSRVKCEEVLFMESSQGIGMEFVAQAGCQLNQTSWFFWFSHVLVWCLLGCLPIEF